MTRQELRDLFQQYGETDFLKFDRVGLSRMSNRPDLNAFMLLDKVLPETNRNIIGDARHDEITLSVDPDDLAKVAFPGLILALVRCGVRYNHDDDAFEMFT